MAKVLLEQIINSNLIRYSYDDDKLSKLIYEAFKGSSATNINLYIDLYSIFKSIYSNACVITDYIKITECILKMRHHYIEFFRKRLGVECKVYFVYSNTNNIPYINCQYVQNYNKKNLKEFNQYPEIDKMIKMNVELLNLTMPYIRDSYFIPTSFETGVCIYDLISRNAVQRPNVPNIVLTKDVYNWQLVNCQGPKTIILRPKKTSDVNKNRVDESFYIDKYNLYDKFLKERKVKTTINYGEMMSELLSLLMTLSSVIERSIKMMCNITTSVSIIRQAISNHGIINGYNSNPDLIWNGIDNIRTRSDEISFINRFKAIDIPYQHSVFMNTSECQMIPNYLIDKDDVQGLKEINKRYFHGNLFEII